jgi:hypothetical protein
MKLSIDDFTWNKATQVLSSEASCLSVKIDINRLLRYETFEVVGKRETRKFCLFDVIREEAHHEPGDIEAWMFRQVDNFGRALGGPQIMIFND